jgi:4-deoxy-L-threo-5-hexosulose-uronate ketol-isomerase
MSYHYSPSPAETENLNTDGLREAFLVTGLFRPAEICTHCTDLDRMILGTAVPVHDSLALPDDAATGTGFFLERREIGIINLGSPGTVQVDGKCFSVGTHDCLYIGLGARSVNFQSTGSGHAKFYFVSTPAHAQHPNTLLRRAEAVVDELGIAEAANRRHIIKYIHPSGVKSCQLMLGLTEGDPGSVWNTMPPHTHARRTEIYLYFDLAEAIVVHLMGRPQATRHLIVREGEAVLSPAWSVHCGASTGHYRFIWAMGGENQQFADMDAVAMTTLK